MKSSNLFSKISPWFLSLVLVSTFIFSSQPVKALGLIPNPVVDISANVWRTLQSFWDKVGSQILNNVLTTTINRLAYDSATYIGSGGTGQKPMFLTKNIRELALEAGDSALGQFLETLASGQYQTVEYDAKGNPVTISKLPGLNLCTPDLDILKRISLGIANTSQPPELDPGLCTFSDMKKAWQGEYDQQIKYILEDGNFGKRLADTLDPGVSEVVVAWEIMGKAGEIKSEQITKEAKEMEQNGGWLRVENLISGKYVSPPKEEERKLQTIGYLQAGSMLKYSGNVLVDAANIFINQLAMSAFNKLMREIGSTSDTKSSLYSNQYSQNVGGVREVERKASKLLQANFSEQADYDILAKLVICPNGEDNPGPTDCVIDQQFSRAIEQQLTVAQAIDSNLLDGDKRLGFTDRGDDLSYLDGYPYRSLLILRKYRVLPVGWEMAAQYIKTHLQATNTVTLRQLLECYDPQDNIYKGYGDDGSEVTWCQGLIDPNWVLKMPKLYCGMQGYGEEIVSNQIVQSSDGYCTKKADVDCSTSLTNRSDDCATDFISCSNNSDCSGTTYTECNFTVGKSVAVTRSDNYCADEQSCLKENANGSCSNYGYCTEEQRIWKFNQGVDNSCEARDNTCQTFSSDTGVVASYLENTLDYANCGANQVGCKQYATTGVYTIATNNSPDKMAWSVNTGSLYFNKRVTDCSADKEGCHQFIRIKDDLDVNLIADGNFESSVCIDNSNETYLPKDKSNPLIKSASAQLANTCALTNFNSSGNLPPDNRWYIRNKSGLVMAGIVNDKASSGGKSLYIEGNGGLYADNATASILPTGFVFETDRYYTLSVNVYVTNGNVRAGFGSAENNQLQTAESTDVNRWQNLVVNYYRPATNGATNFYIEGTDASAEFYIDEVKLSVGLAQTSYSDYLGDSVIYQKLLPNYLEASCYKAVGSNYQLKDDAPEQCKNYARKCNADEVGCETYTSNNTGIAVTAKVKPKDVCPESCLGYDAFVEQATYFSTKNSAYFIPNTAQECSSQAVGCTAFTNLDKLEQGGESTEYYSYLRACIKPDVNSCGDFYTWEGSDDSGYQLRVFSLKKNVDEPAITMDPLEEALVCNETIFKKLPSDPGYNYDCREFYNRDGKISYHLYTRTISCSDSCHPYRREVASEQECALGGGVWETAQARCLYYALPTEGTTCDAAEVGCREYTGNIANNIRLVANNSFDPIIETEPTEGWSGASISNTALNLSEHSLFGSNLTKFIGKYDPTVGTYGVRRNESYTISFLAKAQASNNVSITGIDLINSDNESAVFATGNTTVGADWKIYTFNLDKIDHEVTPISTSNGDGDGNGVSVTIGEQLRINFSASVYIDNIRLTEVPDRYFLIKDSWSTPEECDQTINGVYALRYMLGCSQYKDRAKQTFNLHSFSQLCQDSAAGCEQMIDTYNSDSYKSETYNSVTIPADKIINVAYDRSRLCGAETEGCQRMGVATSYEKKSNPVEIETIFADVYKNNDPDAYNQISCKASEVGCGQWNDSNGGIAYFKDPGDMVCEWRLAKASAGNYDWFKKKVKRCGGLTNGALCSKDADCASNQTCQLDDSDIKCEKTYDKTVGRGGLGGRTEQPSTWAGMCQAEQAGCTEYIDPLSKFNENLIINPDYKDFDTNPSQVDYWQDHPAGGAKQTITLYPHTVYIIKGASGDNKAKIKIECPDQGSNARLRVLDANNNFSALNDSGGQPSYETPFIGGDDESLLFYYQSSSEQEFGEKPVLCTVYRDRKTPGETIYLRKAIVEYQKAQNLDRTSPNGLVNIDAGLILFNERAQEGSSKKSLIYNADKTYDTGVDGKTPESGGTLNANVILKVKPDRTCAKWLSCLTYIPDPNNSDKKVCLEVGLCDKMNNDGTCLNFIEGDTKKNQSNKSGIKIGNLSGYSKVGYILENNKSATYSDYYNIASMYQVGETVEIPNGGFELTGLPGSAWKITQGNSAEILNQPSKIDALNLSPFNLAKNKGTNNSSYLVPQGQGILKLPSENAVTQTDPISLNANGRYVITFYAYIRSDDFSVDFTDVTPADKDFSLSIAEDNVVKNKWVKYSLGFKAASTSYKITLNNANSNGDIYIDDVRIAPALNVRCSDTTKELKDCNQPDKPVKPQYTGSSCRLYASESSLACSYTDDQNIRHKGIYGYCLEPDPKNPASCLLWYPTNRIAGDQNEEAPTIEFGDKDVYYCAEAEDQCDGDKPELFCKSFVKVDKYKYWNTRLSPGSTFNGSFFPDTVLYPTMTVNFGMRNNVNNNNGKIVIQKNNLKSNSVSYPFGAFLGTLLPGEKKTVNVSSGNMSEFLPLWFADYSYNSGGYGDVNKQATPNRNVCQPNVGAAKFFTSNRSDLVNNFDSAYVLNTHIEKEGHSTICTNLDCEVQNGGNNDDADACNLSYCAGQHCFTRFTYSQTWGDDACATDDTGIRAWVTQGSSDEFPTVHMANAPWNGRSYFSGGYNIKQFNVVKEVNNDKGRSSSYNFIKRLFPGKTGTNPESLSRYFNWDGSSYVPAQDTIADTMDPCPITGRPATYQSDSSDYCYIMPIINDFKINGSADNTIILNPSKPYATLSFSTKTDAEQLPIKDLEIDWGYAIAGTEQVTSLGKNLADINRVITKRLTFSDIYSLDRSKCDENICTLNITITLKDNWGYEKSDTKVVKVNRSNTQ